MFAEGGGDGGTGAGAEAGGEQGGAAQPTEKQAAKSGEGLKNVLYGRQEEAAESESAPAPQAEAKPTFDELMRDPAYKAEMQKRMDEAIGKRLAREKGADKQNAKLAPVLNLLAGKYGTKAGDVDAMIEAINADNELIEQQAMDRGMEPEAYREYNRVMAENRALKEAEANRQRQAQADQAYAEWQRQAEQAKATFPDLDLKREVGNKQFADLLGAGIDVETAYRVVHAREISTAMVQRTAQDARAATVAGIQAKAGRPRENGAAGAKPAIVKSDPKQLTRKDFDEILRRAGRGEKTRF